MNKRVARDAYFLIVIVAIAVLAISAFIFTRYLEDQTRQSVEVSTFLSTETSKPKPSNQADQTTTGTSQSIIGTSYANEILQLLAESINEESQIETNYHEFRRGQLDDISLEEYQLYTRLLRDSIQQDVESYASMTYSERKTTSASMLQHDKQYADFLETASFHWLEFHREDELMRFPVLLSQNEDGQSYLSREWVRACLELKNFSTLYFGAFLEQNFEAALRLTYSLSDSEVMRAQKTQSLMDYYSSTIQAKTIGSPEIVSLRMDSITFRIPILGEPRDPAQPVVATTTTIATEPTSTESSSSASASDVVPSETEAGSEVQTTAEPSSTPTASDSTSIETEVTTSTSVTTTEEIPGPRYHIVTIYKNNGNFVPVDAVPAANWQTAKTVTARGQRMLEVSAKYSSEQLRDLLGMPREQFRFTLSTGEFEKEEYIRLVFEDAELIVFPMPNLQDVYELKSVTLLSNRFSLGDTFRIGQSLDQLLEIYLYMDTISFNYTDLNNNNVQLTLDEKQTISQIYIMNNEYRSDVLLKDKSAELPLELIKPTPTPLPTTTVAPSGSETAGSSALKP